MARILVIESDRELRTQLYAFLTASFHDVEVTASAAAGTSVALASYPDVVLVGADLQEARGVDVCRSLRADPSIQHVFVMVLGSSGDGGEAARVAAFEAGADDWLGRPISLRELGLRLRALLRRNPRSQLPGRLKVGVLDIARDARRVSVDGHAVDLTRLEFDLLLRFAEGRGRVHTREALLADLWSDATANVRVVDTTVKRLRRKLGAAGASIRTLRGIGYRLVPSPEA